MADTKATLARKRMAYKNTFCGDFEHPHVDGARVLADLKKFCQVTKPGIVVSPVSGMVDSHASIYQAALRDVYLRISGFLGIDESQLFQEARDEHRDSTISATSES